MANNWTIIIMLINRLKAQYTVFVFADRSGILIDLQTGISVAGSPIQAEMIIKQS